MITEDEARKKWCPFVRWSIYSGERLLFNNRVTGRDEVLAHENNSDSEPGCYCIASDCMAWEWGEDKIKENPDGPVERGRAMYADDYTPAGDCGLKRK